MLYILIHFWIAVCGDSPIGMSSLYETLSSRDNSEGSPNQSESVTSQHEFQSFKEKMVFDEKYCRCCQEQVCVYYIAELELVFC